jgi:hypothetical protein
MTKSNGIFMGDGYRRTCRRYVDLRCAIGGGTERGNAPLSVPPAPQPNLASAVFVSSGALRDTVTLPAHVENNLKSSSEWLIQRRRTGALERNMHHFKLSDLLLYA